MTNSFRRLFTDLLNDESGQDLIEYALVAAIIALGAAATMKTFAGTLSTALSDVANRITASV